MRNSLSAAGPTSWGHATSSAAAVWTHNDDDPGQPPLQTDIDVDAVVIGAGYTGLSAAVELRAAGARVAVIDAGGPGAGASGRNAGHLTPTIGKDLPTLLRLFGREQTRSLVGLGEQAVAHVEATIADHKIDCDYVASGTVMAGLHPGQQRKLSRAVDAAQSVGAAVRMLARDDLVDRRLPGFVNCGYVADCGGVLDPLRYLNGLRRAAIAAGAELFDFTPAHALDDQSKRVVVRTPRGHITAKHAILATNAYTPALNYLRRSIAPLSVTLLATRPLTAEQRSALGWPGGEGIQTAHGALESYRLTADRRIVGGARFVGYRYGSATSPSVDTAVADRLSSIFRARFPELSDLPIERFWSGHIAMTLDFLPTVGFAGESRRVAYAVGCTGHGIAMGSLLGAHTARMTLDGIDEPPALKGIRRLRVPPEPFRWIGVHAIAGGLGIGDRLVDRRAERR